MKVCADSQQNTKKATIWHFKTGDFAEFRQISSKINIFDTRVAFSHFVSFFVKNEIVWSLNNCIQF